jgi:hypothetical protein
MNRRTFLKGAATSAVSGLALLMLPGLPVGPASQASRVFASTALTQAGGRMLRGTRDGLLLESLDGGLTWKRIFNFGSHCPVLGICERQGDLYVEVGLQQYSFFLKSADARTWHTVTAIPA